MAAERNVTRAALALAWLMKHPAKIIPIIGTTNPDHIRAAAAADEIELSREDWYRLLHAARGEPLP
jgi:predicted oxidoreductase